eukprot:5557101-Alexandrium_andersonii.AAC.1
MSASLVGSEMCIRDSSRAERCPASGSHCDAARRKRPPGASSGGEGRGRCLLYTSDAADDM